MKKIRLKGGSYALVDEADYDWVSQREWNRSSDYVGRYEEDDNTFIAMHRALSEQWGWDLDGKFIDHINHDKLDNRCCNLRAVTPGQNARNRKIVPICASNRFLGANEGSTGWQAIIRFEWRTYPIGTYDTQEDTALARNQAARTLDPDHFTLNLPDRPCPPVIAERIEEVLGRPGPDRAFSSYVGVYHWAGWWWAQIIYGNVLYSLGQYRSEEEAALAYDEARRSAYTAAFNLPTHRPPPAVIQQVDRFLNQHNGRRLYGISGYEGVVWDEETRV